MNYLIAQMSVYLYMNSFTDLFFCLHKDISSVRDILPSDWHINPPQGICACLRRCCHAAAVPDRIQAGLREHSNKSDVLVLTAVLLPWSIMESVETSPGCEVGVKSGHRKILTEAT